MNLALALSRVPKHIEITGGLPWKEKNPAQLPSKAGRPLGQWEPLPDGMVEATAICWYIGQVSTSRITWQQIADWQATAYGKRSDPSMVSRRIQRYGLTRRPKARRLPDHILRDCLIHTLILRLHGWQQPWTNTVERLWITHRIHETSISLRNVVMGWAGGKRPKGKQNEKM